MLIVGNDEQRGFVIVGDSSGSRRDRGTCAVNKVCTFGNDTSTYLTCDILS